MRTWSERCRRCGQVSVSEVDPGGGARHVRAVCGRGASAAGAVARSVVRELEVLRRRTLGMSVLYADVERAAGAVARSVLVRLTQEEALGMSVLYADVERALQALWPGAVARSVLVRLTQEEALGMSVLYADVERALQALWPGQCGQVSVSEVDPGGGARHVRAVCGRGASAAGAVARSVLVRLTQEEALGMSVLYADVERALQALWPGCVAMPFGSITTGLGIKTSDADCYLHVPAAFQPQRHTFVNRAKRVLASYPATFAELLAIPRANTPIVKFFHLPTTTNCDLSFKTPLGARNSKLVAFLLHADPRLLPMAVLVKYWAKVHQLSGTGRLTNYALTMMIIFYLQQPPHSILPAVAWLQRNPDDDVIVDHWNTGFMSDKASLPPCANTSSISELLGGFFEYYASFDFAEQVVCPFLGTPVHKDCFIDITKIPKEFDRYKANTLTRATPPLRASTAVCVQDPFEQCHNVASAISSKLAQEIKIFFQFAAKAYENDKLKGCENFLKTILLDKPKVIRAKSHPEYKINLFQRIIGTVTRPDWRDVVRKATRTVFETMLKINLGEPEIVEDDKRPKEKYTVTLTKAIWKRKQFARLYDFMKKPFIEKQARITDEVLALEKETFAMHFTATLIFNESAKNAGKLAIKLTDGDIDRFKEFGKFFISTILSWLAQLIRDECKTSNTPERNKEVINQIDKNDDVDSDDDDDDDAGGNDTEGPENDISVNDVSSTDEAEGKVRNDSESDKSGVLVGEVTVDLSEKYNKKTTDIKPEQKAPDKTSPLEVALNNIKLTESTSAQKSSESTAPQKASDNLTVESPVHVIPQSTNSEKSPIQKATQNTTPEESPIQKAPQNTTPVESTVQKDPDDSAPLETKETSSCENIQSDTQTNS
ncbi:cid1 family poly A polymerase domain-containing protein [Phthorimaea operculella]|nr:cid1 family poly A polymerase domain-containing protein [Phthorimaea operculella]